jgi:hypothetical protein
MTGKSARGHARRLKKPLFADLQHLEESRVRRNLAEKFANHVEGPADLATGMAERGEAGPARDDAARELVAVGHQRPRFRIAKGIKVSADVREGTLDVEVDAELARLQRCGLGDGGLFRCLRPGRQSRLQMHESGVVRVFKRVEQPLFALGIAVDRDDAPEDSGQPHGRADLVAFGQSRR